MKQIVSTIMIALVALCAGAALAVNPVVRAAGSVSGQGDGRAHARIFQGSVTVTGTGILRISKQAQMQVTAGQSGAITREVDRANKCDWVVYTKFSGTAVITGQDVHVFFTGKGITLAAQGAGRAHFVGTGTYTLTNPGQQPVNGQWAARPAKGERPAHFWEAIRLVFGDYDMPKHCSDPMPKD